MPAPPSTTWDPELYLAFDDHRSRPFRDLLARVGAPSSGAGAPRRVVDLGCGPGHLTAALAARWPGARVRAFDSSPEMVDAARARGVDAAVATAEEFVPASEDDVVVTNAVLQWVPSHRELLPAWIAALPRGAWFAMQVPGNFGAPSHVLTREVADGFGVTLRGVDTVGDPRDYASLLADTGSEVDAWETTYVHQLTGDDPVLHWISATALRPVRDALSAREYASFEAALAPRLREAYPCRDDGTTWFPFRRVFAVAHLPGYGL